MTLESISVWRYRLRLTPFWFAVTLFLLALLPRLAAIGRYVTPDELVWVYRSALFRQALVSGAWLDTLTTGHPGVTTTWLGAVAMSVQLALRPDDQAVYEWITRLAWYSPENVAAFSQLAKFLTAGRVAVAVVNSLGVVAMYLLARPLFGQLVVIVSTLLIALDPFIAGLSGLLHVDALMTTFVTLSLLALALTAGQSQADKPRRLLYASISGATAALAILSKSPALLLLPIVALFLCLALFHHQGLLLTGRLHRLLEQGSIWLVAFLTTILFALPALWASPARVVATVNSNASHEIEALWPTFFLGQVAFEHGPLFYPVVLALRLSPIVFLGLILAFYLIIRRQRRRFSLPTALLGLWPLFYIVALSFAAKKFDRYLLPVIPALTFLAAAAWLGFRHSRWPPARLMAPLLVAIQAFHLVWALPYLLAAYNPLLGGPFTAQRAVPLGWGEGISAAGRWLATQPDSAGKVAVASTTPALAPFFPGQTLPLLEETLPEADYVILTAGMKQSEPAVLERLMSDARLIHTVHYGGLDQAWVYAQPDAQKTGFTPPDLPTPLSFGNRVQLLSAGAMVASGKVHVYARWQRQQPEGRFNVKVALRDDQGQEWAELETALLNEVYFYPEHWAPDETPLVHYTLDLPPAIPPAAYTVSLSLFDSNDGKQLPVLATDGAFVGVAYEQDGVEVAAPRAPLPTSELAIPVAAGADWLENSLVLLGHSTIPETVISGGRLALDLYWQAQAELPDGIRLALALGDRQFTFPLSRFDSGRWRPGEVVHEKISLDVPPDVPAGQYSLAVQPLARADQPVPGDSFILGDVEVLGLDRLFEMPVDIATPLAYRFGQGIQLRGLDLLTPAVAPGELVRLTLYWQTETQVDEIYTAFIHVLEPDEEIAFQADRWPGGLPSHTWAAGQVIVDEYVLNVPVTTPAGEYEIAVGLYTAGDGQRLPVTDGDGTDYPDNRVILPVTVTVIAASQ